MFFGAFAVVLDDAGRVRLPDAVLGQLCPDHGQRRLVIFGMRVEGVPELRAFPEPYWRAREAEVRAELAAASTPVDVDLEGAETVRIDAEGRITIPERLRRYAHLSAEVTVVGEIGGFALLDTVTWELRAGSDGAAFDHELLRALDL